MDTMPSQTQILVLGRGMDGMDASVATYERAQAVGRFVSQHRDYVEKVIFSGGGSHGSVRGDRPSEASVMAEIANLPPGISYLLEEESNNTLSNFLHSAALLNLNEPIGIVAHEAHMPRARYLARRVLATEVICIEAESYGAEPEENSTYSLEAKLLLKEKFVLAGIRSGNIERMRVRSERVVKLMNHLASTKKHFMKDKPQYS